MIDSNLLKTLDGINTDTLLVSLDEIDGHTDAVVINLSGYIDTYNSVAFQKKISEVMNAGYIYLLFDCAKLNYMSSTGLGSFTAFLKELKPKNGNVALMNLQTKVLEIFQLLGFSDFFIMSSNVNDCLASMKKTTVAVSVFPKVVSCVMCSKRLNATKSGRFRCPSCRTIIFVSPNGTVALG